MSRIQEMCPPAMRRPGLGPVATLSLMLWPVLAAAQCEDPVRAVRNAVREPLPVSSPDATAPAAQAAGKEQLSALSRTAVVESPDVKAAEFGKVAGKYDLDQALANKKPRVEVSAGAGRGRYLSNFTPRYDPRTVGNAGLSMSAPLYDGGRIDALARQREELFDASSASLESVRERVTLDALLAVLERNRYRTQLGVLKQYVAKLSCLASLTDKIVDADKGRASEQIQARNSLRQAEILRDQTADSMRYAEVRLQTILAGQVLPWSDVGAPLIDVPALDKVLQLIQDNPDVRQLQRQAEAQNFAALAIVAEGAPQVRWDVGANYRNQADRVEARTWNLGVTLSYTLTDGGIREAAVGAAQARTEAARRNLEQAVADRNRQAGVLHDTAQSAFRRAAQYGDLLRDSDSLRRATYVQWASLGRRSLFDLMSAESGYNGLNLDYVNAMYDGFSATAQLRHLGGGLLPWLAPELAPLSNRPDRPRP